jgi:hypothetical protein
VNDEWNLAQGYRLRAEMLRTLAEMDDHRATRERLIAVVKDYDAMAETLTSLHREQKNMKCSA